MKTTNHYVLRRVDYGHPLQEYEQPQHVMRDEAEELAATWSREIESPGYIEVALRTRKDGTLVKTGRPLVSFRDGKRFYGIVGGLR